MKPTHKLTLDTGADTMEFEVIIDSQTNEATTFIDTNTGRKHVVLEEMIIKKERI